MQENVPKKFVESIEAFIESGTGGTGNSHICRRMLKRKAGLLHQIAAPAHKTLSGGENNASITRTKNVPTATQGEAPGQRNHEHRNSENLSNSTLPAQGATLELSGDACVNVGEYQQRYLLFGVKGAEKTPNLTQICARHLDDDGLFRELLVTYNRLRGFWRYWFSIWRLRHCDFVKVSRVVEIKG